MVETEEPSVSVGFAPSHPEIPAYCMEFVAATWHDGFFRELAIMSFS